MLKIPHHIVIFDRIFLTKKQNIAYINDIGIPINKAACTFGNEVITIEITIAKYTIKIKNIIRFVTNFFILFLVFF
jgi:hypothetical protein